MVARPEVLVQLRNGEIVDAEGFNADRRQHRSIRFSKDVEVHRSRQAVACRKRYTGELGKPRCAPETGSDRGYGMRFFRSEGETWNHITPKPKSTSSLVTIQVGRREATICHRGVLSGIVL